MKDLSELVLTIVRPLVTHPEQVQLEVVESNDFYEYNLTVAPEDIGRIIGKQGRVAKSNPDDRLWCAAKCTKKVRLNIVDNKE